MEKLYGFASLAIARLRMITREDGQGAVEYALVVLGVAAIIAAAVAGFTGEITSFMSAAGTKLASYV
jgi:Flp pilus assembly pilin Flp